MMRSNSYKWRETVGSRIGFKNNSVGFRVATALDTRIRDDEPATPIRKAGDAADMVVPFEIRPKSVFEMGSSQSDVGFARDTIHAVLSPYLGSNLALERANNIAQALIMGSDDIRAVTSEMLRNTGVKDIETLVSQVVHAWDIATTGI